MNRKFSFIDKIILFYILTISFEERFNHWIKKHLVFLNYCRSFHKMHVHFLNYCNHHKCRHNHFNENACVNNRFFLKNPDLCKAIIHLDGRSSFHINLKCSLAWLYKVKNIFHFIQPITTIIRRLKFIVKEEVYEIMSANIYNFAGGEGNFSCTERHL